MFCQKYICFKMVASKVASWIKVKKIWNIRYYKTNLGKYFQEEKSVGVGRNWFSSWRVIHCQNQECIQWLERWLMGNFCHWKDGWCLYTVVVHCRVQTTCEVEFGLKGVLLVMEVLLNVWLFIDDIKHYKLKYHKSVYVMEYLFWNLRHGRQSPNVHNFSLGLCMNLSYG